MKIFKIGDVVKLDRYDKENYAKISGLVPGLKYKIVSSFKRLDSTIFIKVKPNNNNLVSLWINSNCFVLSEDCIDKKQYGIVKFLKDFE